LKGAGALAISLLKVVEMPDKIGSQVLNEEQSIQLTPFYTACHLLLKHGTFFSPKLQSQRIR
jgi:hypothetical protein